MSAEVETMFYLRKEPWRTGNPKNGCKEFPCVLLGR